MPAPKQHDSKSKVGHRQSQKGVDKQQLHPCSQCKAPKEGHKACSNCGFYKTASQQKQESESMEQEEE